MKMEKKIIKGKKVVEKERQQEKAKYAIIKRRKVRKNTVFVNLQ